MAASPLRVEDALSYLDNVKNQFSDQPRVYNEFLDIMKEFKSQSTDTPGVIKRVTQLFQGHPDLIIGFNTFLPAGYEIKESDIAQSEAAYHLSQVQMSQGTTPPQATVAQPPAILSSSRMPILSNSSTGSLEGEKVETDAKQLTNIDSPLPCSPGVLLSGASGMGQSGAVPHQEQPRQQFNEAISLIKKIKTRFSDQPNNSTFKEFLDVLNNYRNCQGASTDPAQQNQVYAKVSTLLKDDPDLLEEFSNFLPEMKDEHLRRKNERLKNEAACLSPRSNRSVTPPFKTGSHSVKSERPLTPVASTGLASPNQTNDSPLAPSLMSPQVHHVQAPSIPIPGEKRKNTSPSTSGTKKRLTGVSLHDASKYATARDLEFFEKLKKTFKNDVVYQNFLKCLSIYNSEIINRKELIEIVSPFIGKHPELLQELIKILGIEQNEKSAKSEIKQEPESPRRNAHLTGVSPGQQQLGTIHTNLHSSPRSDKDSNSHRGSSSSFGAETNEHSNHHSHDIDFTHQKRLGSSYRALPLEHQNQKCSSRTPLAASLLNDIWVSLPTWSEDSQFSSSKKNQFEECIIRCEDERFELDIVIEANLDTIKVLEGVQKKIQKLKEEDRSKFKLEDTLGGTSAVIHRRAIHRIYGDKAADIIDGLKKCPAGTVPVVLKRLKAKDEEWKQVQKTFNRLWRDQLQKYYLKSLDTQGMHFKQNDSRFVRPRTLLNEIESLYEERSSQGHYSNGTNNAYNTGPHLTIKHVDRKIIKDANSLIIYIIKKQSSLSKAEKEACKEFLNKWILSFYKINEDNNSENNYHLMYCGNSHFVFFRLHGLLCERLTIIRDKSIDILTEHEQNESGLPGSDDHPIAAVALGMKSLLGVNPDEYYPAFIELVKCYSDGNIENAVYEDTLREMFTTKAYVAYTMDKLIISLMKTIFDIVKDNGKDNTFQIHQAYKPGRSPCSGDIYAKTNPTSQSEINYRKKIEEKLVEDEFLFRITVNRSLGKSDLGIELCNIDEDEDETEPEVEPEIVPDDVVQSHTPLFLRRNLLRVKLKHSKRERLFTNEPSAISMLPPPNSSTRRKIKYTANKSEAFHIPGCINRSKISYNNENGYAVKKHKKFRKFVHTWGIENRENPINAANKLLTESSNCIPENRKCYFGNRKVFVSPK